MCGGNTFGLLDLFISQVLLMHLRKIRSGMPYVSASAGTNITCPTMQTTNDMPNCCIDSCETLGIIPFQINVHYNDYTEAMGLADKKRELRICEYLQGNRNSEMANRHLSWDYVKVLYCM